MDARTIAVVLIGMLIWGCKGSAPDSKTSSTTQPTTATAPVGTDTIAGKHVEFKVVGLDVGRDDPASKDTPVCVNMLVSARQERTVIALSGTLDRFVDDKGADLMKEPIKGGKAAQPPGVQRAYSSSAQNESNEYDMVEFTSARRPAAGAQWVDVEANLRVVTGGKSAPVKQVDVELRDGAKVQVGPVTLTVRMGKAAEKELGWTGKETWGSGAPRPGISLVARKTDWERIGYLEGDSHLELFCGLENDSNYGKMHPAGEGFLARRIEGEFQPGERLKISEGDYWQNLEAEDIPVRLRLGLPPRDVAPGGGYYEPGDFVPVDWKMPADTPKLNGAGTDAIIEAKDVPKPWDEQVLTEAFPPSNLWVPAEVRTRSGRAIIGVDARVDRFYDDAGTDLLHESPGLNMDGYGKGVEVKVRRKADGLLSPVVPGDLGPLTLLFCAGHFTSDQAKRSRVEGELTVITAARTEPVEVKVNLDAERLRNGAILVQLGQGQYVISPETRDGKNTLSFYPAPKYHDAKGNAVVPARFVEELHVLDAQRQPMTVLPCGSYGMGALVFRLDLKSLPKELILTGRVWQGIEQVRVPLRLEWANRWTPSKNLGVQTATAPAGNDLRMDVHGWTVLPYEWDEPHLQIDLSPRSVSGHAKVRDVYWLRAVDDKGTDLLTGSIEYNEGPYDETGSAQMEPPSPGESPLIKLTAMKLPSKGAKTVQLEVWLDVGEEDAPHWIPFRATVPVGLQEVRNVQARASAIRRP